MNASYPHLKTRSTASGFSLVEVVLAMAVVAVGLITIIGLFPQGLTSARRAMDDSLCAMIAQDVIAERRILIQNGGAQIGIVNAADSPRFYTPEGTNTTDASSALYRCEVTNTPVATIANLENTQVRIVWPWYTTGSSTNAPPNTNVFVTMIAKYQ